MDWHPDDAEMEASLRGEISGAGDLADVAEFFSALLALRDRPVLETAAVAHLAKSAGEAAIRSGPLAGKPSDSDPVNPQPRRRIMLSTLLSTLLGKVLATAVAVAAVGAGVGVAADHAAPGDTLYGLDRALESVGIANGGAAERIEEARGLVAVDLPAAVETAAEAAAEAEVTSEGAAESQAPSSLLAAAERIRAAQGEQSSLTRDQVADLIETIAAQLADDGVVGQDVADAARQIGDANPPSEVPPATVPGPPDTVPVGPPPSTPPVSPPSTTPGSVPPTTAPVTVTTPTTAQP